MTERGLTAMQASWSPNGGHAAFVRRLAGQAQIWLAPVPFVVGADTDILADARLLVEGVNAHPVWSPGDDAIAYIGLKDGSFDLFVQPSRRLWLPMASLASSRAASTSTPSRPSAGRADSTQVILRPADRRIGNPRGKRAVPSLRLG